MPKYNENICLILKDIIKAELVCRKSDKAKKQGLWRSLQKFDYKFVRTELCRSAGVIRQAHHERYQFYLANLRK